MDAYNDATNLGNVHLKSIAAVYKESDSRFKMKNKKPGRREELTKEFGDPNLHLLDRAIRGHFTDLLKNYKLFC